MDENTAFQEDSFSFKKIFELLKNSAKRMLIYGIIAAIVGAAVASVVVVATRESTEYKSIIEYNYKNIDDGLDPKGNMLEISRIKSNVMINNALKAMGNISDENIAKLLPILADDIIVKGYISDTMRKALELDGTLKYFPSRYEINVQNNPKTGLSKNQYIDFLNKLMESYSKYFSEYYNFGKYVALVVNQDTVAGANDYINALKTYENEIANLQAEITALPNTYSAIRNKLQARLNILSTQVNDVSAYILKNNVQKAGVSMTLAQYLANEKAKNIEQEAMYSAKALKTKAILADYKVIYEQITNTNDTLSVTVADVTQYNKLISEYQNESFQAEYFGAKIKECQRDIDQLTAVVSGNLERTILEDKFTNLYSSLVSEIDGINEELTNYANLNLLSDGVKVAMSATTQINISYLGAIVSFVIILLAGIFIAIFVTYSKGNKILNLKEVNAAKQEK